MSLAEESRTSRFRSALAVHTQVQLRPARVSVRTLTEHGLRREGRVFYAVPIAAVVDCLFAEPCYEALFFAGAFLAADC